MTVANKVANIVDTLMKAVVDALEWLGWAFCWLFDAICHPVEYLGCLWNRMMIDSLIWAGAHLFGQCVVKTFEKVDENGFKTKYVSGLTFTCDDKYAKQIIELASQEGSEE